MSKRNRREHGRILSVETMQRGSALDIDAAAGATSITVVDGGDFDEDGGWLYIGAQVVEFTECDDDTGIITLAAPLTVAAEQGDPVAVYDPLYEEVVDYQEAHVQLDGEYDNPDVVVAEVAEGVEDLPEGDRGKAGESCTLLRVADDEWEIVGVGGRSRRSRGIRFEADDTYVLTADDITAGTVTVPLTRRPVNEGLTAVLAGVPQRPTNYTINYDAQMITWPLSGWEKAGDRIWLHYAYRRGLRESPRTLAVQMVASGHGNGSIVMPAGVQDGDLVVVSAAPSSGTSLSAANGYSTNLTTANVTHSAHFGTYTYRLMCLSKVLAGGAAPVPSFSGGNDLIWVVTVWRGPSAVTAEAHGTVADAKTADTPALSPGHVRSWVALGDYPTISLTGEGTIAEAHNSGSDVAILVAVDAGDGVVPAQTAASSAGWMVGTMALAGVE